MKQRLEYIDLFRGLSIFLVVWHHTMTYFAPEGSNPLGAAISAFNMSMFFFISGYVNSVAHDTETVQLKKYIIKKIETILLPFFSWSILVPLFCGTLQSASFSGLLDLLLFYPNLGIWFLPVLLIFFGLYVLKTAILRKYKVQNKEQANILICVGIISLFVIIGLVLREYFIVVYGIYAAAFFFGEIMWKSDGLKRIILSTPAFGVSALMLLMASYLYPLDTTGVTPPLYSLINLVLIAVCSLFACVFFFNFFIKVKLPSWFRAALSEAGKSSIMIYLIPLTIIIPYSMTLPDTWSVLAINLVLLIVAAIDTLLRYILGKFINQIPYVRYILFGKR